mmetsp:Transcript_39294/g.58379  ORF Transcript_39294/g.58379 Transcript_39294/m.58379 type:complete len:84 (+) Transcript_39294:887-1138(+)
MLTTRKGEQKEETRCEDTCLLMNASGQREALDWNVPPVVVLTNPTKKKNSKWNVEEEETKREDMLMLMNGCKTTKKHWIGTYR